MDAGRQSPDLTSTTICITGPHADCHLSKRFRDLRETNQLTDYTIHSGPNSFPCHGQLLAVHSTVFLAMIDIDMREKNTKQIQFPEVAPRIMSAILDYLYSGRCRFHMEDACGMIEATHYLDLRELTGLCVQKLISRVAPDNVISLFRLAERFSLGDMKMQCQETLCLQFNDVISEQSFLDLGAEEIDSYFDVATEYGIEDFFLITAAFLWVAADMANRNSDLENLLKKADLLKCSPVQMQYILENFQHVLQENPSYYRLFMEAYVQRQLGSSPALYIVGMHRKVKVWKLDAVNQFTRFGRSVREGLVSYYRSVCVYASNTVIVTGGFNSKVCLKWTVDGRTWARLPDMSCTRYHHVAICMGDMLFVFGGIIKGKWTQSVAVLFLDGTTRWHRGPRIPMLLRTPKAASIGADIFVLGNIVTTTTAEMFCLDTNTMRWSAKAACHNAGSGFSVASCESKLLIAGGNRQMCKSYDPVSDAWTELTRPLLSHNFGSLVAYEGKMILMGGHTPFVEQYDASTDTWSVHDMTVPAKVKRPTAFRLQD